MAVPAPETGGSRKETRRSDIFQENPVWVDPWTAGGVGFAVLVMLLVVLRTDWGGMRGEKFQSGMEQPREIEFLVDLNRANEEELGLLPGIGPQLAARIVAYRTQIGGYRAIEDLLSVPGIGPVRLTQLREFLVDLNGTKTESAVGSDGANSG